MSYPKSIEALESMVYCYTKHCEPVEWVCNSLEVTLGRHNPITCALKGKIGDWLVANGTMYGFAQMVKLIPDMDDSYDDRDVVTRPLRLVMLQDLLNYYRGNCATPLYNSILGHYVEVPNE